MILCICSLLLPSFGRPNANVMICSGASHLSVYTGKSSANIISGVAFIYSIQGCTLHKISDSHPVLEMTIPEEVFCSEHARSSLNVLRFIRAFSLSASLVFMFQRRTGVKLKASHLHFALWDALVEQTRAAMKS